jgi:hypothetical protein
VIDPLAGRGPSIIRKALLLGVSEVRLEHPTRDHGETRSDRRFVGFQLRVFFPSVFPIEYVELQVGDGVISSQRVQRLMQVEELAARELAFRSAAAASLVPLSLAAIP